ncbi:phage portal protein [Streptomyces sp. AC495_CC817]|uniref:phage portal protein n=1 Tax=Streptomyces sp. AC495_CC817 TaxID=2823900 RepID=UPI001C254358|nr:phage portal protein [Streptomyces sp. AC495_CC817]
MTFLASLAAALGLRTTTPQVRSPWREDGILEHVTYEALYGDVSEVYVSRDRAMRLPVISKARRAACVTVGRLPLAATRPNGRPWPLGTFPILEQPEAGVPLSNTLAWTIDGLMFHPYVFWQVTARDSYGWPVKARLVPHSEADVNEAGELIAAFGEKVTDGFIRFDGFGAGLLRDGGDTIRRAMVLNRVAALAEANPVPSIELHNEGEDISDEQIDAMVARWVQKRKTGNVAYTNRNLKAIPHGQQPEQLLIDARKRIDLELTRHTGAPAWVTDTPIEGASLTYQNRASRNWELIDLFLTEYMTAIEDRLSMADVTPRGTQVKFLTDELTRDDMKTRFETYGIGKKHAFITDEWIAEQEGWEA